MDCIDHRWGHRVPVHLAVSLASIAGAIGAGTLVNLSISGARLITPCRFQVPTLLRLTLSCLEGRTTPAPTLLAWVVRNTEDGAGLEWDELAPALARRIVAAYDTRLARFEPRLRDSTRMSTLSLAQ